jgi:hypothetical protein
MSLQSLTFGVTPNYGPAGAVAKGSSAGGIDLTWEPVPGATGFYIERSPDGLTGWTPIGNTLVPGDSNADGVVNFADFVRLSNHYGQFGGWSEGDFNGDWTVNFADFVVLSNHYGMTFDGTSPAALSFHDATAVAGQTYYYRVWAGFTGGTTGGASEPVAAVAGGESPLAPAAASASITATTPTTHGTALPPATPIQTAHPKPRAQAQRRQAALRAAQWWWGWWRSMGAWAARAR